MNWATPSKRRASVRSCLPAVALIAQWEVVTRDVALGFWLLAAAMMFVMRIVKRAVLRQFRLHGQEPAPHGHCRHRRAVPGKWPR